MKRCRMVLVLVLLASIIAFAQSTPAKTAAAVRYGSNPAAGRTFTHDGVKLYYEVYGTGEPLLIIHGNGGSMFDVSAQIVHFRKHYRVIAMDSRDQGRSADTQENVTYEKMADDLAALLDHLKVGPANVLGWSDGAIEALLLGMRHPTKVMKIAAMAANLNPSDKAVQPEILALVKEIVAKTSAKPDLTPHEKRDLKLTRIMLDQPNINTDQLASITAPTLILAADHDVVVDEHTVDIFHHIPNSQLCIFPNATHMIPFDDPVTFNNTVERFFRTPFVKKDRIKDTFGSLEKLRAAQK